MRWITRPGWPGNLLAVAAGALTTLALARRHRRTALPSTPAI